MYAVNESLRLCFLVSRVLFSDTFSYSPVGEKHKLFYQFVGIFALLEVHGDGFPCLIGFKPYFCTVKVHTAGFKAFCPKHFGEAVQLS